jgi:hypothetical protein
MKLIKMLSIVFVVLTACAFLVPMAAADEWNNRTTVNGHTTGQTARSCLLPK